MERAPTLATPAVIVQRDRRITASQDGALQRLGEGMFV